MRMNSILDILDSAKTDIQASFVVESRKDCEKLLMNKRICTESRQVYQKWYTKQLNSDEEFRIYVIIRIFQWKMEKI